MSDVIYNETGIGDLKGKTPNYNFNIPYFDIATWHDYIEENFRSIDALFHYIYEIKQYKGKWENNTTYKVDDVLFIIDDNSEFNGRLVKVLLEHTTSDKTFDEFYTEHNEYYELFLDASAAHGFALEAKSSSDVAKEAEENCQMYSESAYNSMQQAKNSATQSQNSENNSYNYQEIAKNSAEVAKLAADKLKLCPYIVQNVKVPSSSWEVTTYPSNLSQLFTQTYQYQAKIVIGTNVDIGSDVFWSGNLSAFVTFEPNEIISGDFAPICYSAASYTINRGPDFHLYIYSKTKPTQEITLPSVTFYWKE